MASILQGRQRPLPWPIFVTRMLMRDLLAVANNLVAFGRQFTNSLTYLLTYLLASGLEEDGFWLLTNNAITCVHHPGIPRH